MFIRTSPSAATFWQSPAASSSSMLSLPTGERAPTIVTSVRILPFSTLLAAAAATATPVVANLNTDVTISNHAELDHVPLQSFWPTYDAMSDRSLFTNVYVDELRVPKAAVFVAGALCVFFLRNTWTSFVYLWRTRVKDKTLFYLLLASQLAALVAVVVKSAGLLDAAVSCDTNGVVVKVFTKLSGDLMIMGILGVKAYRCLGNSCIILTILLVAVMASWILDGLQLWKYEAHRAKSGMCEVDGRSTYLSALLLLDFAQTAALCGCFFYAIWKSYRTRAEARVSISVSGDGKLYERNEAQGATSSVQPSRGWWDYVPTAQSNPRSSGRQPVSFLMCPLVDRFRRLWAEHDCPTAIAYQRKSSLPGEFPIPQPPRRAAQASRNPLRRFARSVSNPILSCARNWGLRFANYQLFQLMLRNELLYTTLITGIFLALSIAILVGIHSEIELNIESWATVNWVVVAMCTMQSFGRVFRRHELEFVLQHPAAWDRMLRIDVDYTKIFFGQGPNRFRSSDGRDGRPHPGTQSDDGAASMLTRSHDIPLSSYTVSPISPCASRKPSAASSLPSLRFEQPPSPHEAHLRTPTSDTVVHLPYPSPTTSFAHFSFNSTHTRVDADQPPIAPTEIQNPLDERRLSLDVRTSSDLQTDIDRGDRPLRISS